MLKKSLFILVACVSAYQPAQAFEMSKLSQQWDQTLSALAGQGLYLVDHCDNVSQKDIQSFSEMGASLYYPKGKVEPARLNALRKSMQLSYLKAHQERVTMPADSFSSICQFVLTNNALEKLDKALKNLP